MEGTILQRKRFWKLCPSHHKAHGDHGTFGVVVDGGSLSVMEVIQELLVEFSGSTKLFGRIIWHHFSYYLGRFISGVRSEYDHQTRK